MRPGLTGATQDALSRGALVAAVPRRRARGRLARCPPKRRTRHEPLRGRATPPSRGVQRYRVGQARRAW
jgi:hypothetical protein